MRCLFSALIVSIASIGLWPVQALAGWPPDGIALAGPGVDAGNAFPIPDGAGGWYVAWEDGRNKATAGYDIRVQRVSAAGLFPVGWPSEGLLASGAPNNQFGIHAVQDGFGGYIVVWNDLRNGGDYDVYAQRFMADGSLAPGWPVDGAPVSMRNRAQFVPFVASDGQGGAYFVWEDWRIGYTNGSTQVYGQHLTATGTVAPGWPQDGREICSQWSGLPTPVVPDGAGGFFTVWTDSRRDGQPPNGYDVYGQHILASGEIAPGWQVDGNLIASQRVANDLVADGTGGIYVDSFSLDSASVTSPQNYWLARRGADGGPVPGWTAEGVPLRLGPGYTNGFQAIADAQGGVIAAWYENRGTGSNIYAVRILPSGAVAPGWMANGTVVSDPVLPNEHQNRMTPDGTGGAYVVWERYTDLDNPSFVQHMNASGARYPGWPIGGQRVASSTSQFDPDVSTDGQGGALVTWEEGNGTGSRFGVFADYFVAEGIVAAELSLASSDATVEGVRLVWQGVGAGDLAAWVERREEASAWERIGEAQREAPDRLSYADHDVTPGTRYGYRLGYVEGGGSRYTTASWIEVPRSAMLALEGLRPNPAVETIRVSFSLPTAERATLELLDLAGRRVLEREVGGLGAGRHVARLDGGEPVTPGVYWLRLRQGERELLARAVVMR